jgi:hypothetical protein
MPARKPHALHRPSRHTAASEARERAESALAPKTKLASKPPAALAHNPEAARTWKRLIALFREVQATMITAFDEDLLVKYCLAKAELQELKTIREEVKRSWELHKKLLERFRPKPDQLKDYFGALQQANALLQRYQGIDARLDGKRKLLHALQQSMYLTPRSRAGTAPAEREPEMPLDGMETLLGEDDPDA